MAQILAAINLAQDHKWPIPMANLLSGSVSQTYQNLRPVAHHISQGQATKDGRIDDASTMENTLMQQPNHLCELHN